MSEHRIIELETQNLTLQRRLEEMEVRVMQAERDAERARLEAHIREAALEAGALPGAAVDVAARVLRSGSVKIDSSGAVVVMKDGATLVDEKRNLVSVRTLIEPLKKTLPNYFQESSVTPAMVQSPSGDPVHTGDNPWLEKTWNMTSQARIVRANRKVADRLAAEAGTFVGAHRPNMKKGA